MNVFLRQRQGVDNALSLAKDYEALCDSEGRAVMANLPDGTRLRWRQIINNGDFSMGLSGWNNYNCNVSLNNKVCSVKITDAWGRIQYPCLLIEDNRYLYTFDTYIESRGIYVYFSAKDQKLQHIGANTGFKNVANNIIKNSIKSTTFAFIGENNDVSFKLKNVTLYNLTDMFSLCPSLLPSSTDVFWSEGTESDKQLGYTAYTEEPVECIVYRGKIYKIPQ